MTDECKVASTNIRGRNWLKTELTPARAVSWNFIVIDLSVESKILKQWPKICAFTQL